MRLFNKDSELTYSQFEKQYNFIYPELNLNLWVNIEDMTNQEKKEEIGWEMSGGYLKKLGYKEAWQEYWNRASDSDKEFFTTLPNFDVDIFFEITSIDTRHNTAKIKSLAKEKLLEKAQQLTEQAEKLKLQAEKM